MRLFGLLADPGDLGLGPVADARDVLVGDAAQLRGLFGAAAWMRSVAAFASAVKRSIVSAARGLGGRLHGLRQVGHELVRLLGGRAPARAPRRRRAPVRRRRAGPSRRSRSVPVPVEVSVAARRRRSTRRRRRSRPRPWRRGSFGGRARLGAASVVSVAVASVAAASVSAVGSAVSASARSELHGSRKPGRVSVCAMRRGPRWLADRCGCVVERVETDGLGGRASGTCGHPASGGRSGAVR